ncbi:phage tail protein [Carnobacterium divergens]|uniref:GH25 family lysozyme n=1 Tax=Carnobacterium divergens TaxID=2748 RepID=UPI0039C9EB1C
MHRISIINNGIETIIHSGNNSSLKIEEGTIVQGINVINSFTFSITSINPGYGKINPRKTFLKIVNTKNKKIEFEGFILKVNGKMDSDGMYKISYTCVDELYYLKETKQRHGEYHDKTPKEFLTIILKNHNKRADSDRQFQVGEVTVTNSTDNVYRYLDPTKSTWENIFEKLIDGMKGELRVRKENGVRYLDWLVEIGEKKENPKLSIGRNLISSSESDDLEEIYSRLIPLGARVESENKEDSDVSQARVTIETVNNGKDYIDDLEAQQLIGGIKEATIVFDDVHEPSTLLKKAEEARKQNAFKRTIEVNALDLFLIGKEVDSFEVSNYYMTNTPFLSKGYIRVIEKRIDILRPWESSLTIGEKTERGSSYQAKLSNVGKKVISMREEMIAQNKRYNSLYKGVNDSLTENNKEIEKQRKEMEEMNKKIKELENQISPPNPTEQKGSDVSEYNASIDWVKFKSTGHTFVMIKGGYGKESSQINPRFSAQVQGAISQNIKIGMYWFSYATNVQEAIKEANLCCDLADKYRTNISYPISFDWENDSMKYANSLGVYPDKQLISDMAIAFCNKVAERGYKPMNYSNLDYYNNYFDDRVKKYDWWLARPGVAKPDVPCAIWQSELDVDGTSRGINGNADFDISFKNY